MTWWGGMEGHSPLPSLLLEDVLPHGWLQPTFILQAKKWELSSGKDPAHFAVSWSLCRDVGPSHQRDPAAVPFTQTRPEVFFLTD